MRGVLLLLLLLLLPSVTGLAAAGRLAPAKGMLLVAAESIGDPRFRHSVILLIEHGKEGVAGLIVNRPSSRTLGEALGRELDLRGNEQPLFYGGPVGNGAVTCLLRGTPPAAVIPVAGGLSVLQVERVVPQLKSGAGADRLRIVSGYAGWNIRQLAGEIDRGSWYVIPADSDLIFDTPPEQLWETLRKRGNELWI